MKTHSYEHARGLLPETSYSDNSTTRSYTYNHLGRLTQLVDDAGVRRFGYNSYGESETDSLAVDGDTHLITETRDSFGRSTGYTYAKNGSPQQTVTTGYGLDGRIDAAGFTHGGAARMFSYEYLPGTNLLRKLSKPNGMTLTQSYEATRDLLTGMAYHRGSTLVAQREYTYDILGRPTARNTARQGSVVNDTFAHNTRSELVEAQVNGKDYEYAYDNIGNRTSALEESSGVASRTEYTANALNQYTTIAENGAEAFVPQFDADGNQTLIKTETGIWSALYNAENRPVSFTNSESNTVVECQYDSMGRRAFKKVTVNGSVTLHQRYVYRGYLQIACIDLTRSHHPVMWLVTWDPSQPVATRPLAIQLNGTWYTYGWDLTKNICELYGTNGYIATTYTYSPFGQVTTSGNVTQPIQWSSEQYDSTLDLSFYNYRNYVSYSGRWLTKDKLEEKANFNLYMYTSSPIYKIDILGLVPTTKDILSKLSENGRFSKDENCRVKENWCQKMGEAINIIAHDESIKDWADFNEVFAAPWYGRLTGTGLGFSVAMELAIYLNKNTEVNKTLMDPNKATACQKDALGLKDEFMANGYETIKHFANSFAVGSLLATAYGLTFDQFRLFRDMLRGNGDPLQRIAEMTADFVGAKISDEFGEMLANSTPFWADKEYFDEAWNKNKHKIKELWLSNFCRARDNSLKCEC